MDSVITCLCVLCEFPWKSHGWRIIVVTNGWATTPQQLELQNNEQLFRFCWRKEWIIEFSPLFSTMEKNCQKDVSPQIVKRKKDNRRWCYRLKSVAYIRCFEKSTHGIVKVLQLATINLHDTYTQENYVFTGRTIIRIPITTLKDNCFSSSATVGWELVGLKFPNDYNCVIVKAWNS